MTAYSNHARENFVSIWPDYAEKHDRSIVESGFQESASYTVESGAGYRAVFVRNHFEFMGGSMGATHGRVVKEAVELAMVERLPVVFVTRSGGARTQEGSQALLQMAAVSSVVGRARRAGIPFLSYMRDPTMGGVLASYASAADITIGEPGARISFAGPRVAQAASSSETTASVLTPTSEELHGRGLVDYVAGGEDAVHQIETWLRIVSLKLRSTTQEPEPERFAEILERLSEATKSYSATESLMLVREESRPSARNYAHYLFDEYVELFGDRISADDGVAFAFVGSIDGNPAIAVGYDRQGGTLAASWQGAPSPGGLRKLFRAVELANRLQLPVITLVDTIGADPRELGPEGSIAVEISKLLEILTQESSQSLGIITGEGGSGAAMALAATKALVMFDDSLLNVIAPEAGANLIYRDLEMSKQVQDWLQSRPDDLIRGGCPVWKIPGPKTVSPEESMSGLRRLVSSWLYLGNLNETDPWFETR